MKQLFTAEQYQNARIDIGLSVKELADRIGVSARSISHYENGTRTPTPEILRKLRDVLNLKSEHLEQNNFIENRRSQKLTTQALKRIPFYDTEAIAGTNSEIDMSPTQAPSSQIDIGDFLRDSTAAIRVYGNSMQPNYPPGCVIGLIPNEDGIIQPGEVYVVETAANRYIKRLYYNEDRTAYVCYSDNVMKYEEGPMAGRYCYDKFEIPLQKVKRVFEVTGVIKRNRNSPILQK